MASLVVSGEHPELKRLFVSEDARGVGPAGNLLDAVEKHARDASARVIQLETGNLSDAAIALYEKRGYRHIPRFGGYVGSQSSVCMELKLSPRARRFGVTAVVRTAALTPNGRARHTRPRRGLATRQ